MSTFHKGTDAPFSMQDAVHRVGSGRAIWKCAPPGTLECHVIGMSTLRAGPVSVSKRGCLVQEKQLRIAAGLHNRTVPTAKLQSTGDPAPDLPVAHHAPVGAVQN